MMNESNYDDMHLSLYALHTREISYIHAKVRLLLHMMSSHIHDVRQCE